MPQPTARDNLRRSVKWRQRRQAIVDASAKVFAERGYHATSTVELCEANDIGKGALYYYIGSKEQLLVAIAGGGPQEQLTRHGEELLDVIDRYPDHVWVFLHEFPALTGENAESFRKRRRAYERRIEAVFEEGIESGDFRTLDPRLAVIAWLGMHNYTYLWMRSGGRWSVHELASSYADIFIRGVTSSPTAAL